jgi:oxygenase
MSPPDVVLVGAGPVGLLLALELRLGGAEVLVVDSLTEPSTASRASTLHARTMELFDQRGLLGAFDDAPVDLRGHFAGIPLDLGATGSRYAGQWKVLQHRTEQVLAEHAVRAGARLRRGVRLTGLAVHDAGTPDERVEIAVRGPEGTESLTCRDLVGCDGEHSAVRSLAGFPTTRVPATRRLLRADVEGVEIPNRRFERLPGGVAIAARRPDGVTRVMMCDFEATPGDTGTEPAFEEICGSWKRITGEDLTAGRPLWLNAFDDAVVHADSYRLGPVLLAGDAAHVQLPVGGQALNLGLQDATNLGWKLAAVVTGRGGEELLDSYGQERHAVGVRTLANIRAQAALLFGGDEVEGMRGVLAELCRLPAAQRSLAGVISATDIGYPAAADEHPSVGRRLPVIELSTATGTVSSAELLRTGRGLLLSFDADTRLARELAGYAAAVMVVAARPLRQYPETSRLGAVLVRPDGHIAWAREQSGPDRTPTLRAALARWFTPSTERKTP